MTEVSPGFKQGTTFALPLRLHPVVAGVAVADLTGWTARAQVRQVAGPLVSDLGVDWVDRAARLVTLTCPAATTTAWPVARLNIDVELTSPDGQVRINSSTMTINVLARVTQ
jgi:hypothetical protein